MWPHPFKKQWILFPSNSPVPVKKIHSFKEKECTLNKKILLFFFLPSSSCVYCGLHIFPFHWSMIWLWSQSLSKSNALRIWLWGHLHCVYGAKADIFSLKNDMKPSPTSSESLCWHFLRLQEISNTSSHNFCILCSGLEFQSFSAAVLMWIMIKQAVGTHSPL